MRLMGGGWIHGSFALALSGRKVGYMGGTKRAVEQLADGPSSCLLGSRLHADDFSALYRHYVTPLYRYFHYQVAEVHQAEDLTASTLLRAFESRHRFEGR